MKLPLFLSLLLAAGAVSGQDSPEARAILARVTQASQTARSYRAEFTGSVQNVSPGSQPRTVPLTGGILFQPPDKLRVEMKVGAIETMVIRDGAQGWVYDAAHQQYTKVTAAAFANLNPATLDLSALFGNTTTSVEIAKLGPEGNLSFEGKPVRSSVVLTQSNPGARDPQAGLVSSILWIDRTNYTVLRRRSTWTTHPAQVQGPVETTTDIALTNLTFNPKFTGAEFTFTPPRGATATASPAPAVPVVPPPRTAPPAPAGPRKATVLGDSVPMYAKMSESSPVVAVLHKDDVVTIDFSVGGADGAWCSVTQVGEGGKSGNVRCGSLK